MAVETAAKGTELYKRRKGMCEPNKRLKPAASQRAGLTARLLVRRLRCANRTRRGKLKQEYPAGGRCSYADAHAPKGGKPNAHAPYQAFL